MQKFELIMKYGVPAVLFFWLVSVQIELSDVKNRMYDCFDQRLIERNRFLSSDRFYVFNPSKNAIRAKEPKIKKDERGEMA